MSKRVFKFRAGNENDLDSFFENYMWFANSSDLNDPYEGYASFSDEDIDDDFRENFLAEIYAKQLKPNLPPTNISPKTQAKDYRDNYERRTGTKFSEYIDSGVIEDIESCYSELKSGYKVLSLSLAKDNLDYPSPLSNMLMWSHYANGFKGFCVEYDFEKLKSSIESKNSIELTSSQVTYSTDDNLPIIKLKKFMQSTIEGIQEASPEILQAFTKKAQSWTYENEVRFIAGLGGKLFYNPDCINAIYISEKAPNWLKNSLMSNVILKQANIKTILVSLHASKYQFSFSTIDA
jgi:hypothetical protein